MRYAICESDPAAGRKKHTKKLSVIDCGSFAKAESARYGMSQLFVYVNQLFVDIY